MVLGPFPERKGPRLPGRNPANFNIVDGPERWMDTHPWQKLQGQAQ